MNQLDKIIEEFDKLRFETDWQEMRGDKLVPISPKSWLSQKLTEYADAKVEEEKLAWIKAVGNHFGLKQVDLQDNKVGEDKE